MVWDDVEVLLELIHLNLLSIVKRYRVLIVIKKKLFSFDTCKYLIKNEMKIIHQKNAPTEYIVHSMIMNLWRGCHGGIDIPLMKYWCHPAASVHKSGIRRYALKGRVRNSIQNSVPHKRARPVGIDDVVSTSLTSSSIATIQEHVYTNEHNEALLNLSRGKCRKIPNEMMKMLWAILKN